MRSFLTTAAFALTLAAAIVLLAVALWNEGCNRTTVPYPVQYTGRNPAMSPEKNATLPGQGPNDRILIIPSY